LNACRQNNGSTCTCVATDPKTGACTAWSGANITAAPPPATGPSLSASLAPLPSVELMLQVVVDVLLQ
jgi:hypothetical protein